MRVGDAQCVIEEHILQMNSSLVLRLVLEHFQIKVTTDADCIVIAYQDVLTGRSEQPVSKQEH